MTLKLDLYLFISDNDVKIRVRFIHFR